MCAADVTFIPMACGFLYLVVIIDWARSQVRSLHRPPSSPGKPTRFPGRQKPSQFR